MFENALNINTLCHIFPFLNGKDVAALVKANHLGIINDNKFGENSNFVLRGREYNSNLSLIINNERFSYMGFHDSLLAFQSQNSGQCFGIAHSILNLCI